VSFGGEVTGTFGSKERGYFNYTDYRDSLLRLFTAQVAGAVRLNDRLEALGEFRLQNTDATASGLYARFRPWPEGSLAIQAGRIPPVFGRFSRRGYGRGNPLIGVPLAYQYLTTLRPTEIPVGADALLTVRGRGWFVVYPQYVGVAPRYDYAPGLPLVSAVRWDTGVQVHIDGRRMDAAFAITNGSLSNTRVDDDNGGKQLAGRVTWQPTPIVDLGLSLSRGAFLARSATDALPLDAPRNDFVQSAVGVDAEVSAGHWVVRGETIVSRWTLPAIGSPALTDPLRSIGMTLESRYRFTPRLQAAIRGERLLFSEITGNLFDGQPTPWDAPVGRLEVGTGYSFSRRLLTKVAWQYNWRQGVQRPRPREGFLAAQVSAWF
jgi:hypothetical protein